MGVICGRQQDSQSLRQKPKPSTMNATLNHTKLPVQQIDSAHVVPSYIPSDNLKDMEHYREVVQLEGDSVSEVQFVIRHSKEHSLDIQATLDRPNLAEMDWIGLPDAFAAGLAHNFDAQLIFEQPLVCLRLHLIQLDFKRKGFRPFEEISQLVKDSCHITHADWRDTYAVVKTNEISCLGCIKLVKHIQSGESFILKQTERTNASDRQSAINECSLMSYMQSAYLVKCVQVFDWKGQVSILMEFMESGALTGIIKAREGKFSEAFCKYSLYTVARGLFDLHQKNVLHRDIKSDNILCRANGDIKIADLGFAVFLSEAEQYRLTFKGTMSWISPELAAGLSYSKEVDMWAYGCFAYELATGEPPFFNLASNQAAHVRAILQEPIARIPSKWSDQFADFVSQCLQREKNQRATIEEILAHDFLQGAEACKESWVKEFCHWQEESKMEVNLVDEIFGYDPSTGQYHNSFTSSELNNSVDNP